jgi:hypothetical protein
MRIDKYITNLFGRILQSKEGEYETLSVTGPDSAEREKWKEYKKIAMKNFASAQGNFSFLHVILLDGIKPAYKNIVTTSQELLSILPFYHQNREIVEKSLEALEEKLAYAIA